MLASLAARFSHMIGIEFCPNISENNTPIRLQHSFRSVLNVLVFSAQPMNKTKSLATYLPLAAILIVPAFVVAPFMQTAYAQTEDTRFLVRVIQGTAQTGLVNVSVQLGSVIVNDVIDVNRNNIAIPITVPIAANVNVGAQVCATVLSSGDIVCEAVQEVEQNAINRVVLNLTQAQ